MSETTRLIGGTALLLAMCAGALAEPPSCNTHKSFPAADLSQPVTTITTESGKTGVEAFKAIGVKTLIRYYDWPDAEITCKSLLPAESDAILEAGLNLVTVFQHENDDPETFLDRSRGTADAKHALKLAAANGQPAGSAIYFAVDGVDQTIKDAVFEYGVNKGQKVSKGRRKRLLTADPAFRKHIRFYERFLHYHAKTFRKPVPGIRASDMIPFVEHYFRSVRAVLKADGKYKLGAYGSGMMCQHLMKKGLADFCWLAMSTGWPGHKEMLASGKWSMVQQHSTTCNKWHFNGKERVRFDFNRVNAKDVGQWSKKAAPVKLASLPSVCKPSW